MNAVTAIWGKELRSLLTSPVAYIFLMVFVTIPALRFFITGVGLPTGGKITVEQLQEADLEFYFASFPLAFALLIPALAMKLWPDELKSGTYEILFSHPVSSWQAVFGKWLAGMFIVVVGLLLTVIVPATVGQYGDLDSGPVWGAYLGTLILGMAFMSVGLFLGALCKEQVTAFILGAIFCGFFAVCDLSKEFLPAWSHAITEAISFSSRFRYLGRGVVVLRDVLYFVSFSGLFLLLNVAVLEIRKGR